MRPTDFHAVVWKSVGRINHSRCQSLHRPRSVGIQLVKKPVVQAVFTSLPKLDVTRTDAVPAPHGGKRNLAIHELLFDFRKLGLQEGA